MIFFVLPIVIFAGSIVLLWLVAKIFSIAHKGFMYSGKFEPVPTILFQITSKDALETIKTGVNSIFNACQELNYSNYKIWIVTDSPKPLKFNDKRIEVIVVPPEFSCEAEYKARALEYAKRLRKAENYTEWIYFMDEENWITKQTVAAITNYAQYGNTKIASGPLTFHNGGSKFVWLGDSMRGAARGVSYLGHSLGWWWTNGENLLLHSDVEYDVGWQCSSLTEDYFFSASAGQRGYRTGWHGGRLFSFSPANIIDLCKQRRRWFTGVLQIALSPRINMKYKVMAIYLLFLGLQWIPFMTVMVICLLFDFIPIFLCYIVFSIFLFFAIVYFVGCSGNLGNKTISSLLSWLFLVFESLSAWYSIISPAKEFDIIKKANSNIVMKTNDNQ